MLKRVLKAYNELKDNGIDLILLKNIIELNTDKKLNKGWYFIEEGNISGYDFFDCFEILQLYNTLKREGSYKAELDGHKIKIELDTGLCTLEKKDNKYCLFGETINESFDIIWDLFNYLGKHYKRQYIRINNLEASKTDDRIYYR